MIGATKLMQYRREKNRFNDDYIGVSTSNYDTILQKSPAFSRKRGFFVVYPATLSRC